MSAILLAVVFWSSRLKVVDTKRFNRLIRKASDDVGMKPDSLTVVSEWRMLSKLQVILDKMDHPLCNALVRFTTREPQENLQPSSCITLQSD